MADTPVDEELATSIELPRVPPLFSEFPPIRDTLETDSSKEQNKTTEECLPYLTEPELDLNVFGIPQLRRKQHATFLRHALENKYPPNFVSIDASRPWIPYWALTGLSLLGEDVSQYGERITNTFVACQNPDGGFGGGHGQASHAAASYAAILALATVGGKEALDSIDRKAMWHWLGRMKQHDGGFTMSQDGEEDIRGAYCAMTIISLLNLPLSLPPDSPTNVTGSETFLTGLPEWIGRCQSFEGGIGGAPNNEAHGAYAFCGLACLSIIGPPQKSIAKYLNVPSLIAWLSSQQRAPEGGFAGRTNKLVDGCYSHWVGGCWALLSAALQNPNPETDLWSREGLVRYILCCCQHKKGGLRDKPSKHPDAYHSCYNLAGLSAAQNYFKFVEDEKMDLLPLTAPYGWSWKGEADVPCEETDRVTSVHPVFVIPFEKVTECRTYFEEKEGF